MVVIVKAPSQTEELIRRTTQRAPAYYKPRVTTRGLEKPKTPTYTPTPYTPTKPTIIERVRKLIARPSVPTPTPTPTKTPTPSPISVRGIMRPRISRPSYAPRRTPIPLPTPTPIRRVTRVSRVTRPPKIVSTIGLKVKRGSMIRSRYIKLFEILERRKSRF